MGAANSKQLIKEGELSQAIRVATCATVNAGQLTVESRLTRRTCTCCGWKGLGFRWTSNEHRINPKARCPQCGSSPRHRALAVALPELVPQSADVLHFAPERQLQELLRDRLPAARYDTTDLNRDDVDLPGLDIQALDLPDGSYDVVLCNHVLEHVPDDRIAVHELARVIRTGGIAIITVPGDWEGTPTRAFRGVDGNGHWRHYGNDFAEILNDAFDSVQSLDGRAVSSQWRRFGIRPDEPIFVCSVAR